jgi:hypothetical protein
MGDVWPGSHPTMLMEQWGVWARNVYTWCSGENFSDPLRSRMSMVALLG